MGFNIGKNLACGKLHDTPGALITDAQLAALSIEYAGVLHTTDRRFRGLRWKNPLANTTAAF